jgi:hypothetical protein
MYIGHFFSKYSAKLIRKEISKSCSSMLLDELIKKKKKKLLDEAGSMSEVAHQ